MAETTDEGLVLIRTAQRITEAGFICVSVDRCICSLLSCVFTAWSGLHSTLNMYTPWTILSELLRERTWNICLTFAKRSSFATKLTSRSVSESVLTDLLKQPISRSGGVRIPKCALTDRLKRRVCTRSCSLVKPSDARHRAGGKVHSCKEAALYLCVMLLGWCS